MQHLTGWLAQLFGLKEIVAKSISELGSPCIHIAVQVTNGLANKDFPCHIAGEFYSVYTTENRCKPVMSLAVIIGTHPSTNHMDGDSNTHL
ncbi:unnamed protein product [Adineta ricciae]|uniref:Uncharacterized protein n=1 Tax=Adineta ricciae TaxID=249248 RepID=A0A815CLB8_ADIRI|nr:unnamed protein product [Adineta ricciae]CAF1598529.1 unnamed protein product [Adineta ricciae]